MFQSTKAIDIEYNKRKKTNSSRCVRHARKFRLRTDASRDTRCSRALNTQLPPRNCWTRYPPRYSNGWAEFWSEPMKLVVDKLNHAHWLRIADVANSKCPQRLDKILIIFTRTIQEISKVVCKKTYVRNARTYDKLMLYETRALRQAYAAQTGLR